MKVDLGIAYDSINWSFIKNLLMALKVPLKFVNWLMICIFTPSFSLSINEGLNGFFKGKKGLRRGDFVSPLVFVPVMEYFTRLLKKMSQRNSFHYHYNCAQLKLTHLMSTDDLMLFCKGDVQSVSLLVRSLNTFAQASGLHLNQDKFVVYFGNVPKEILGRILQVSGSQRGVFSFRYLGIPITAKKIAKSDSHVL